MRVAIFLVSVALTAYACSAGPNRGVNTGNGLSTTTQASVAVGLVSTGPSGNSNTLVTKDASGTAFTIEAAHAYLGSIELNAAGTLECSTTQLSSPLACDGNNVTIEGPFAVDLIAGSLSPSLGTLWLPTSSYQQVHVGFIPGSGSSAAADANTLSASGTFIYQGSSTPFQFALQFTNTALMANSSFSLDPNNTARIALQFDVSEWFQMLPITACLQSGDLVLTNGVLVLADQSGACGHVIEDLTSAIEGSGACETYFKAAGN